ncbi:hypothetical protein PVAND_015132 [Polypedilum vanderplanki]|uniref:Uncharacterized protein n=1 Tax=Polypedilum vanderplanki TaxID=319348 RepID=A0A9J6BC23_POLVA|nr:hypothetical protein PVAND_015132 [Polypedilum vanderplanki]
MLTEKFFIALIAIVYSNSILVLSNEVQLTCVKSNTLSQFSVIIDCSLPVEEPIDLTVTSSDIDFEQIKSEENDKRIAIEIIGNENYPENMPEGLGRAIDGVEIFTYRNTSLKSLKRSDFTEMSSKLFKLFLDHNKIEEIEPETFHDLTNLFVLSLGKNKLKTLPSEMLSHAPKFSFLIIKENEITELSPELFKNSPKLKKLFASKNQISELHPELFVNNPELMIIGFRDNKIKNVPYDFRLFNSLYIADFMNNADGCDTIYNVNEFKPNFCNKECQERTIKNIDEFQIKIEEICRN